MLKGIICLWSTTLAACNSDSRASVQCNLLAIHWLFIFPLHLLSLHNNVHWITIILFLDCLSLCLTLQAPLWCSLPHLYFHGFSWGWAITAMGNFWGFILEIGSTPGWKQQLKSIQMYLESKYFLLKQHGVSLTAWAVWNISQQLSYS